MRFKLIVKNKENDTVRVIKFPNMPAKQIENFLKIFKKDFKMPNTDGVNEACCEIEHPKDKQASSLCKIIKDSFAEHYYKNDHRYLDDDPRLKAAIEELRPETYIEDFCEERLKMAAKSFLTAIDEADPYRKNYDHSKDPRLEALTNFLKASKGSPLNEIEKIIDPKGEMPKKLATEILNLIDAVTALNKR